MYMSVVLAKSQVARNLAVADKLHIALAQYAMFLQVSVLF